MGGPDRRVALVDGQALESGIADDGLHLVRRIGVVLADHADRAAERDPAARRGEDLLGDLEVGRGPDVQEVGESLVDPRSQVEAVEEGHLGADLEVDRQVGFTLLLEHRAQLPSELGEALRAKLPPAGPFLARLERVDAVADVSAFGISRGRGAMLLLERANDGRMVIHHGGRAHQVNEQAVHPVADDLPGDLHLPLADGGEVEAEANRGGADFHLVVQLGVLGVEPRHHVPPVTVDPHVAVDLAPVPVDFLHRPRQQVVFSQGQPVGEGAGAEDRMRAKHGIAHGSDLRVEVAALAVRPPVRQLEPGPRVLRGVGAVGKVRGGGVEGRHVGGVANPVQVEGSRPGLRGGGRVLRLGLEAKPHEDRLVVHSRGRQQFHRARLEVPGAEIHLASGGALDQRVVIGMPPRRSEVHGVLREVTEKGEWVGRPGEEDLDAGAGVHQHPDPVAAFQAVLHAQGTGPDRILREKEGRSRASPNVPPASGCGCA